MVKNEFVWVFSLGLINLGGIFAQICDEIKCNSTHPCTGSIIQCNDCCDLICEGANVCQSVTLDCFDTNCTALCSGDQACMDFEARLYDLATFQSNCIGNGSDTCSGLTHLAWTRNPTSSPTPTPTKNPSSSPTFEPTGSPSVSPTETPSESPSHNPTQSPSNSPTENPTHSPTLNPSENPTFSPTDATLNPTNQPSMNPTDATFPPSASPTECPTAVPTNSPSPNPSKSPSSSPTQQPTFTPTAAPTCVPILCDSNLPDGSCANEHIECFECCDLQCHSEEACLNAVLECHNDCAYTCNGHDSCKNLTIQVRTPASVSGEPCTANECDGLTIQTLGECEFHSFENENDGDSASILCEGCCHIDCLGTNTCNGIQIESWDELNLQCNDQSCTNASILLHPTGGFINEMNCETTGLSNDSTCANLQILTAPTPVPTVSPTPPTWSPTESPSMSPSLFPTNSPTKSPTCSTPIQCVNPNECTQDTFDLNQCGSLLCHGDSSCTDAIVRCHDDCTIDCQGSESCNGMRILLDDNVVHTMTCAVTACEGVTVGDLTPSPTLSPTDTPSGSPTMNPTQSPSSSPSNSPTFSPSLHPSKSPSLFPTNSPTNNPTSNPSPSPTDLPTDSPSLNPTHTPTAFTQSPSSSPSENPTMVPSESPSDSPSDNPTTHPTGIPSSSPTPSPSNSPSKSPSDNPTLSPSNPPSENPTVSPNDSPTNSPSVSPSVSPTNSPSESPTVNSTNTVIQSESESARKKKDNGKPSVPILSLWIVLAFFFMALFVFALVIPIIMDDDESHHNGNGYNNYFPQVISLLSAFALALIGLIIFREFDSNGSKHVLFSNLHELYWILHFLIISACVYVFGASFYDLTRKFEKKKGLITKLTVFNLVQIVGLICVMIGHMGITGWIGDPNPGWQRRNWRIGTQIVLGMVLSGATILFGLWWMAWTSKLVDQLFKHSIGNVIRGKIDRSMDGFYGSVGIHMKWIGVFMGGLILYKGLVMAIESWKRPLKFEKYVHWTSMTLYLADWILLALAICFHVIIQKGLDERAQRPTQMNSIGMDLVGKTVTLSTNNDNHSSPSFSPSSMTHSRSRSEYSPSNTDLSRSEGRPITSNDSKRVRFKL